jgi:hypothetical protein
VATTGLCRYDAYAVVAAQLDGGDLAADACDQVATYRTILRREGDGLTVEVCVEVCLTHDLLLSTANGWKRSIKIRRRAVT